MAKFRYLVWSNMLTQEGAFCTRGFLTVAATPRALPKLVSTRIRARSSKLGLAGGGVGGRPRSKSGENKNRSPRRAAREGFGKEKSRSKVSSGTDKESRPANDSPVRLICLRFIAVPLCDRTAARSRATRCLIRAEFCD